MIGGTTHARVLRQRDGSDMYWDHMTVWGWMMMLLWTIVLISLAAGMIWAILASRPASTRETPSLKADPPPSARELLDQRLARGEVDTDEYQQRRRALEEPLTHR
jgi:putative membrane protein